MKREVNNYTDDFKLKVVQENLMSDATFAILQKKYDIRSGSCITEWIRKFDLAPPSKSQIRLEWFIPIDWSDGSNGLFKIVLNRKMG